MDVIKVLRQRLLGDLIRYELDPNYTRERVTFAANAAAALDVPQFSVVGEITANGEYVPVNAAGADGSENAAGVVLAEITAPQNATQDGDVLVRGPALVCTDELVFPAGSTQAQQTAWIAQLKALGIIARAGG